jgi:hypothetical protein
VQDQDGQNNNIVEEVEEYYQKLEQVLQEISKKDFLILMGDWNAKIGKGEEQGIIGKYNLGNRYEAGERLIEFC